MALTNYTELQAAIASELHRTDLTTQIVDFIARAEAVFNRRLKLRTMESDNSLSLTSASRTVALPSGFVEPISLDLVIDSVYLPLTNLYKRPQDLDVNTGTTGRPRYWSINGTNIEFEYPADQTYTLNFRQLTSFNLATTSTNWLLTNHPDLYISQVMAVAARYIRDDPSTISMHTSDAERLLNEVQRVNGRTKSLKRLVTDLFKTHREDNIITGEA